MRKLRTAWAGNATIALAPSAVRCLQRNPPTLRPPPRIGGRTFPSQLGTRDCHSCRGIPKPLSSSKTGWRPLEDVIRRVVPLADCDTGR